MRQHFKATPLYGRARSAAVALLCGTLLSGLLAADAVAAMPEPVVTPSVYRHGTTAVFGGAVDPEGSATAYHFEYVDDSGYQVSGFAGATSIPSPDASAGSGATVVSVAEEVTDLAPGTYHLRLVATSGGDSVASAPTTFSIEATGACANETLRGEQVSATLPEGEGTMKMPDCMALEMATPPAKENQPVKEGQPNNSVAFDGDHVFFRSDASLAETAGVVNVDFGDVYVAIREDNGWMTRATVLRPMSGFGDPVGLAPDLSSWFQIAPETEDLKNELKFQAFRSAPGGQPVPFSPLLVTADQPQNNASYAGSSADASHLYIKTGNQGDANGARFFTDDPKPAGTEARNNVYVLTLGVDGQPAPMQLLARDGSGKVWGANCGARVGGDMEPANTAAATGQRVHVQGAISEDGSRVYFSTRPSQPEGMSCNGTSNKMRILERTEPPLGPPAITELVQDECARVSPAPACNQANGDDYFQGASADGTKVYFTTTRQLVDSDLDSGTSCGLAVGTATGCDLYLYEKLPGGGHNLIQVSAGDASDPTSGAGAKVPNNIAGISTDGSHVYFVAGGVLTTKPNEFGAVAKAGQSNFYLYERDSDYPSGRTVFIGTLAPFVAPLAPGDSGELWGAEKIEAFGPSSVYPVPAMDSGGDRIGGDGHVLLFRSKAELAPNDTDTLPLQPGGPSIPHRDVYRYDSQSGSLECVSCLPGADSDAGEARAAEDAGLTNGRPQGPSFASLGRWVSEDGNSVVFQTTAPLLPGDANKSRDDYLWRDGQLTLLPGAASEGAPTISGGGGSVAFRRAERLLPAEDGDSTTDIYVLRAGGGFPIPPDKPICIPEVNCQPRQLQPSLTQPASETASGSNVSPEPPPARCRKGFVRRKGKCVKRHRRHKHHQHRSREAGTSQGGRK